MTYRISILLAIAIYGPLAPGSLRAAGRDAALTSSTATARPAKSPVERIGPHQYRIGKIRIDSALKEIVFDGRVNMQSGLIEVVIATEEGKLHEAVIAAAVRPLDLHLALLLLGLHDGLNPGWQLPGNPKLRQPGWNRPPGSMVDIFMSWGAPPRRKEIRIETTLMDIRTSQSLPRTPWVFTGSIVGENGNYAADEVGSLVTNYHDSSAVLDNPLQSGELDDYTYADPRVIPPVGTPVQIRIKSTPNPGDNKK